MSVAVVTDSTSYLPPQLLERWGIHQVSLYVGWDGDLRPEHELRGPRRLLRAAPRLAAAAHDLTALGRRFPELLRAPRAARATMSSPCTSPAACRAPVRARARPPGSSPRTVAPGASRSSTARRAPAVWAALRSSPRAWPRRAVSLEAVVDAVRLSRESLDIWFCLDTLEYLRRGGRIGAAQAVVGTALKIKPILTFGTEIAPVGRVRTQRSAPSSEWSTICASCTTAARATGSSSTPSSRRTPSGCVAEGTAIFGYGAPVLHRGGAGAGRAPRVGDARWGDDPPGPSSAGPGGPPRRGGTGRHAARRYLVILMIRSWPNRVCSRPSWVFMKHACT